MHIMAYGQHAPSCDPLIENLTGQQQVTDDVSGWTLTEFAFLYITFQLVFFFFFSI